MHHNRSLLPHVEVLLDVLVKTSTCSTKLLFVILNFYSRKNHNFDQIQNFSQFFFTNFLKFFQISEFQPNFRISTKFQNFNQISEFLPNFRILTKFQNLDEISEFHPNFILFYQIKEYLSN